MKDYEVLPDLTGSSWIVLTMLVHRAENCPCPEPMFLARLHHQRELGHLDSSSKTNLVIRLKWRDSKDRVSTSSTCMDRAVADGELRK